MSLVAAGLPVVVGLLGAVLAADPRTEPAAGKPELKSAVAVAVDVRKAVERSLPFLEKEGTGWMESKKCSSCHHVPMMLWTHYTARRHGFAVNDETVAKVERWAIAHYFDHPTLQPTGQDKSFLDKPLGPGTIFLTLGMSANPAPDEETRTAIEKLRANFVKNQNANGSWTTKIKQPPLSDQHDCITMLTLLALGDSGTAGEHQEAWKKSLAWLGETPVREETQPLALRLLIAQRAGNTAEIERLSAMLQEMQQPDGGWRPTKDHPTDALYTGQALCALSAAGVPAHAPAISRAVGFLASTQREDGSWLVHTRNPKGHDPIISYYGSGWATLGLLSVRSAPTGSAGLPVHRGVDRMNAVTTTAAR